MSERIEYTQWLQRGPNTFIPTDNSKTILEIPPGVYNLRSSRNVGFYLFRKELKLDELIKFDTPEIIDTMSGIQKFWDQEAKFKEYGFVHKRGILLYGAPGCHAKGTKIMMYDGSIKNVEDIVEGELLMGPDSLPRTVLSLARDKEQMVKIIPNKGEPFIVNINHILSLKNTDSKNILNISVKDYIEKYGINSRYKLYRVPVNFSNKVELLIDPYIMGTYIGDGTRRNGGICGIDQEIIDAWNIYSVNNKLTLKLSESQSKKKVQCYFISNEKNQKDNIHLKNLKKYNLRKEKRIPKDYLLSDEKSRLELLAGIIDADGCLSENCFDITLKQEHLIDDIIFVARSLGFSAYKKPIIKYCIYKGKRRENIYYRTVISGDINRIPTKIKRKQAKIRQQIKDVLVTGFSIEFLEEDNYYGFELDKDHLYLMGDFTVTHNTGKTSLINLVIEKLINDHNGVVFVLNTADDLSLYESCLPEIYRVIEPNRKVITIIEDIDGFCSGRSTETTLINILDGIEQSDNILYLATTNYPERIPARLLNRPNRFDRRIKVGFPPPGLRKQYFESKLHKSDLEKIDINKWVAKTDGMSIAHLGELIKSVIILENDFLKTINILSALKETPNSVSLEKGNDDDTVGFKLNKKVEYDDDAEEDDYESNNTTKDLVPTSVGFANRN